MEPPSKTVGTQTTSPDIFSTILLPTLSYAAIGCTIGTVVAISRAKPIGLYLFSTGSNFAILGGLFSSLRVVSHVALSTANASSLSAQVDTRSLVMGSGLAGIGTGAIAARLTRHPRGYLVMMLGFGTCSSLGELTYQYIRSPAAAAAVSPEIVKRKKMVAEEDKSVWQKLKESSPLRPIPNDEFRELMQGKIKALDDAILAVDQEIAYTKSQIADSARRKSN